MIEHFFVQGSQRFQIIELTSPGSLALTFCGFKPVTYNILPEELPGVFECSDSLLNSIWKSGARTVQINAIPARSNPIAWQPTSLGVIISSQRTSHYVWGGMWTDYTFHFEAKIIEGGLAFAVRNSVGFGPLFQVYSDAGKTRIDLLYGFYNQEQITLWPTEMESKDIDLELKLDTWHKWEIKAIGQDVFCVSIDGHHIGEFLQGKGEKNNSNGIPTNIESPNGSIGIGTGAGQTAMFRNASVIDPAGKLLYANSLRDQSVLSDFAVNTNSLPVCFDGAKRDRAVWLGDTITPALALYYSTCRPDFIAGSIEAVLGRQQETGKIPAYGLAGFPLIEKKMAEEAQTPYDILAGNFTMYVVRICYEHFLHTGKI